MTDEPDIIDPLWLPAGACAMFHASTVRYQPGGSLLTDRWPSTDPTICFIQADVAGDIVMNIITAFPSRSFSGDGFTTHAVLCPSYVAELAAHADSDRVTVAHTPLTCPEAVDSVFLHAHAGLFHIDTVEHGVDHDDAAAAGVVSFDNDLAVAATRHGQDLAVTRSLYLEILDQTVNAGTSVDPSDVIEDVITILSGGETS